jgi:hypothetical protein
MDWKKEFITVFDMAQGEAMDERSANIICKQIIHQKEVDRNESNDKRHS